jgi:hypothetical protein
MQKLEGCVATTAKSIEEICRNIEINKDVHLEVSGLPDWREQLPIAIVGGGPSLKDTIHKLKDYRYIMVCGSAHDYVIKAGYAPTYAIICDPDPLVINYMRETSPYTKYLIASQCDPIVFQHVKYDKNYVWHCGGDGIDQKIFGEGKVVLGGGSTVGTRAMYMALAFGFSDQHLFGFDTCLSKDFKHHSYDFDDPEKETLGNIHEIALDGPNGKKFHVAGYMLAQLFDFQNLLKAHANRIKVTVHGEGLLKHLMDITERKLLEAKDDNQK